MHARILIWNNVEGSVEYNQNSTVNDVLDVIAHDNNVGVKDINMKIGNDYVLGNFSFREVVKYGVPKIDWVGFDAAPVNPKLQYSIGNNNNAFQETMEVTFQLVRFSPEGILKVVTPKNYTFDELKKYIAGTIGADALEFKLFSGDTELTGDNAALKVSILEQYPHLKLSLVWVSNRGSPPLPDRIDYYPNMGTREVLIPEDDRINSLMVEFWDQHFASVEYKATDTVKDLKDTIVANMRMIERGNMGYRPEYFAVMGYGELVPDTTLVKDLANFGTDVFNVKWSNAAVQPPALPTEMKRNYEALTLQPQVPPTPQTQKALIISSMPKVTIEVQDRLNNTTISKVIEVNDPMYKQCLKYTFGDAYVESLYAVVGPYLD